ncbi:Trk system potassium transporter TrkA [Temperatibacter marinus]|uniref:Trk system potassium uptake protein TrkA n=1 Tax=Temperatibacter marinus TaxID=1456591 RepID=A0AA52EGF1_9PROT|nr:Trk system potassium transporter TrkA [Temperatibacter marinus]WND02320.1 Trk system potassium transporter TrkA [Temperatibacter marinus]
MKIIVCGAGQVGFNIAKQLSEQGSDVTVIDQSAELVRKISDSLDVQGLVGHASDPYMLEKANATDADLIVAVTISDEVNMVACQVAHSLFQVPTKIARIRNQSYLKNKWADLFNRDNMPIDVIISPEKEVAEALARRMQLPGAFNMMPFVDDRVRVIGMELDENCPVVNTPLRQLTELFPKLQTSVLAIYRKGRMFLPSSADQMEVGDEVYVAVDSSRTERTMSVFGHEEKEARRVVIIGGGNVGFYLARSLEENDSKVNLKIVEMDPNRAEKIALNLDRSLVINGDALSREILTEVNVSEAETLVAVADDDEVNILTSLLAKREGCERAIALINNPVYGTLTGSLGVDVALDPRETTVSSILRHIRRGRIRDLYSVREGQAEIIEAEVIEGSEVVGQKISQMKLKGEIRIGIVIRGDDCLIPTGDTRFEPGDRVVLLSLFGAVSKVEKLFSARSTYF